MNDHVYALPILGAILSGRHDTVQPTRINSPPMRIVPAEGLQAWALQEKEFQTDPTLRKNRFTYKYICILLARTNACRNPCPTTSLLTPF
jgi:hypothetical protein